MSKGQRGNKEAKKPKKLPGAKPVTPGEMPTLGASGAAPTPMKKK